MRSSGGVGLATYGNWKTSSAFGDSNPGSCAGCTHFGELEAESAVAEMTLGRIEGEHIIRILEESKGKLGGPNGAAARLGSHRTTLQSKLRKRGIGLQKYRAG
jgi:transcriptional regulator with GAF, ATPase, and Fis domain